MKRKKQDIMGSSKKNGDEGKQSMKEKEAGCSRRKQDAAERGRK